MGLVLGSGLEREEGGEDRDGWGRRLAWMGNRSKCIKGGRWGIVIAVLSGV